MVTSSLKIINPLGILMEIKRWDLNSMYTFCIGRQHWNWHSSTQVLVFSELRRNPGRYHRSYDWNHWKGNQGTSVKWCQPWLEMSLLSILSLYILSLPNFCSLESTHFKKIRRLKYSGSIVNVCNYLFWGVCVCMFACVRALGQSSNPEPHTCWERHTWALPQDC